MVFRCAKSGWRLHKKTSQPFYSFPLACLHVGAHTPGIGCVLSTSLLSWCILIRTGDQVSPTIDKSLESLAACGRLLPQKTKRSGKLWLKRRRKNIVRAASLDRLGIAISCSFQRAVSARKLKASTGLTGSKSQYESKLQIQTQTKR